MPDSTTTKKSGIATGAVGEKKSGASTAAPQRVDRRDARARGGNRGASRRRRIVRREERALSEFDQKIISIRRVTRVMAGGRRFSFSVALVVGDRKHSVGVGTGKASDTALAIEKAARNAKKHMIKILLNKEHRISHETQAKYCASHVWLSPAPGKGVVAGGAVRTVLELGGVKDVTAKILSRSKNKLNNASATIRALSRLH